MPGDFTPYTAEDMAGRREPPLSEVKGVRWDLLRTIVFSLPRADGGRLPSLGNLDR